MFELRAKSKEEADIVMYGSISEWGKVRAEDLISRLASARAQGISRVNLKINSPGGSITEGVALMTQLGSDDLYITATVEGIAASMASVMIQGADRRRMVKGGRMMVHQGQGGVFGSANYIHEYADLLDSYNKTIADIYAQKSKRDAKYILENWMKEGKDTWFTADQALKEGLIDEIVDGHVKPLEKENATMLEMAAHYQSQIDTTETMNKLELIALLGLKADATEAEINTALKELKAKADVTASPAKPATPAADEKTRLADEIVAMAKDRGADEALQATIKRVALLDASAALTLVPKGEVKPVEKVELPKPLNVNDLLAAMSANGGSSVATDRAKWDWDEWSKHPKDFQALLEKNPKDYIKLFKAKFDYEPGEAELKGVVFKG